MMMVTTIMMFIMLTISNAHILCGRTSLCDKPHDDADVDGSDDDDADDDDEDDAENKQTVRDISL